MPLTRVVSTPAALDAATVADTLIVLRTAPDEVLVIGNASFTVDDPHAIVVEDGGWCGAWMPWDQAEPFLRANCSWDLPTERPAMAQGRVADAPAKLWLEEDRMLFLVPHVTAVDVGDRMNP